MEFRRRLDVIQRRMVRFIQCLDVRSHVDTTNLFSLSWLSVPDRVAYFHMLHLFRIRHDLAPSYLRPNFVKLDGLHTYKTRNSGYNYHMSRELSIAQTSFAFSAVKMWNSLPGEIKAITSLNIFKKKLKEFYLSAYHNT